LRRRDRIVRIDHQLERLVVRQFRILDGNSVSGFVVS
jgi:hypothetical protein